MKRDRFGKKLMIKRRIRNRLTKSGVTYLRGCRSCPKRGSGDGVDWRGVSLGEGTSEIIL